MPLMVIDPKRIKSEGRVSLFGDEEYDQIIDDAIDPAMDISWTANDIRLMFGIGLDEDVWGPAWKFSVRDAIVANHASGRPESLAGMSAALRALADLIDSQPMTNI